MPPSFPVSSGVPARRPQSRLVLCLHWLRPRSREKLAGVLQITRKRVQRRNCGVTRSRDRQRKPAWLHGRRHPDGGTLAAWAETRSATRSRKARPSSSGSDITSSASCRIEEISSPVRSRTASTTARRTSSSLPPRFRILSTALERAAVVVAIRHRGRRLRRRRRTRGSRQGSRACAAPRGRQGPASGKRSP